MSGRLRFRRVLLGVHQNMPDSAALGFAAGFAESLHLEMLAMIVEEPRVTNLAGLPHVREFRMLDAKWRPLDTDRMAKEFESAAEAVRRLLNVTATSHRISCAVEVVRAGSQQAVRSFSQSTDIIILSEPKSPIDRIVGSFPEFSSAAVQSEAAILYTPKSIGRHRGPVVAIAATPDDFSIDVAAEIAVATGEKVVLLEAYGEARDAPQIAEGSVQEHVRIPRSAMASELLLSSILGARQEKLIVMTRRAAGIENDLLGFTLAALRRVPVLVLEPAAPPRT
jgi:hypothetical protein